ncbi:D-lactaldehyde dehydrogenase [Mycena latifolia]|nr:D-lactaldehyde dehydrogenase [Mycena latifolia]
MPAVSSGKVLVSGANGFIAAWVVRSLLEEGFSVRGAVRSENKGVHLREMFASYGDKFELVVVPDMAREGAFDDAVKGVHAIEHTASPTNMNVDDPAELITPAIEGTVGILQSALVHGTSVRRVVVTSSAWAVLQRSKEPKTFSERDWDDEAPAEVAALGAAASAVAKYAAAKTLAERAAWDFVEKHKSEIGWDLVVLNPPGVFGPHIHDAPTPNALRTSPRRFYTTLTEPSSDAERSRLVAWVDVRDLARAHVLALVKAAAGGERIIISAGSFVWQDCLDAAPDSPQDQKGVPGGEKGAVRRIRFDASKSARVLGMTAYRGLEEMVRDTVADWEARGW